MDISSILGGAGGFSLDSILKEDTLRMLFPVVELEHDKIMKEYIANNPEAETAFNIAYVISVEKREGEFQPIIRQVLLKMVEIDGVETVVFAGQSNMWNLFDLLGQAQAAKLENGEQS